MKAKAFFNNKEPTELEQTKVTGADETIEDASSCPKRRKLTPPVTYIIENVPMPLDIEQTGKLYLGPGAEREAMLLGIGLPDLLVDERENVRRAKKYCMDQSIKQILLKQTVGYQQHQTKITMYAQALSLMSRLYVGNVVYEVKENNIKTMFRPFGPIKSIHMPIDTATGNHKTFCFVEFEVPESAELAKEYMNDVLIGQKNIVVGRPLNVPQAQAIIEQIMAESKQHFRIFVSSIHEELNAIDVKQVFLAFGDIQEVKMPEASVGKHRGYCYITYTNAKACADAVASMNGFDLGGMYLRVTRAITPPSAQNFGVETITHNLPMATALCGARLSAKIIEAEAEERRNRAIKGGGDDHSMLTSAAIEQAPPRILVGDVTKNTSDRKAAQEGGQEHGSAVYAVPPPGLIIPQSLADADAAKAASMNKLQQPTKIITEQKLTRKQRRKLRRQEKENKDDLDENVEVSVKPLTEEAQRHDQIDQDVGIEYGQRIMAPYGVIIDQVKEQQSEIDPDTGAMLPPVVRMTVHDKMGKKEVDLDDLRRMAHGMDDLIAEHQVVLQHQLIKEGIDNPDATIEHKEKTEAARRAGLISESLREEAKRKQEEKKNEQSIAEVENQLIRGVDQRQKLMAKLLKKTVASSVLVLKQMVTLVDVDDSLEREIESECAKFGKVERVTIVYVDGEVKIFVKFAGPEDTEQAKVALNGRYFGGRNIVAEIYDYNMYKHDDYSG